MERVNQTKYFKILLGEVPELIERYSELVGKKKYDHMGFKSYVRRFDVLIRETARARKRKELIKPKMQSDLEDLVCNLECSIKRVN